MLLQHLSASRRSLDSGELDELCSESRVGLAGLGPPYSGAGGGAGGAAAGL